MPDKCTATALFKCVISYLADFLVLVSFSDVGICTVSQYSWYLCVIYSYRWPQDRPGTLFKMMLFAQTHVIWIFPRNNTTPVAQKLNTHLSIAPKPMPSALQSEFSLPQCFPDEWMSNSFSRILKFTLFQTKTQPLLIHPHNRGSIQRRQHNSGCWY